MNVSSFFFEWMVVGEPISGISITEVANPPPRGRYLKTSTIADPISRQPGSDCDYKVDNILRYTFLIKKFHC